MKTAHQTVFVTARVLAKPEFAEQVKTACLALVEPSRKDAGCISYRLFQSSDAPNLFIFFEEWATGKDLDDHLESDHAAGFDRAVAGLLLEDEEIVSLRELSR